MNDLTIRPLTPKEQLSKLHSMKENYLQGKVLELEIFKNIKSVEKELRRRIEAEMKLK